MFKGLRFQKRLRILPGARINLSKSGASASVGPRGADVNIGRHGVTTNAGIPGTGLSYRRKVGGGRGMLGILALIAGLGLWTFQHRHQIAAFFVPEGARMVVPAPVNTVVPGLRYVHRDGSILRDKPNTSGAPLKKESKGARVTLISQADGWAQVTDGGLTGYMRASVLGAAPPR